MERSEKVLVLSPNDKSGKLADELRDVYGAICNFAELEYTGSLRKAINSFVETDFDLCFISSNFPSDDIKVFFEDYENLLKGYPCGFIHVHRELREEYDRQDSKTLGFHSVISLKGTQQDRDELSSAMSLRYENQEIIKRKIDVDSALNVILRKIDTAARNLKRGIFGKIDAVPTEFIELQTAFHPEIMSGYYKRLEKKTETAEPENAKVLSVPESVLKRELPKLEKNKYTGASNRVWRRLLRKHGIVEQEASTETSVTSTNIEELENSPLSDEQETANLSEDEIIPQTE